MGSLTFSEMATIAVIVLIIFGPKRLPELARRAGAITARVRDATRELRDELREEYRDTIEPLQDVRRDLEAARDDLAETARSVGRDLEADVRPMGSAGPGAAGPRRSLDDIREQLRAAREELSHAEEKDGGQAGDGTAAP